MLGLIDCKHGEQPTAGAAASASAAVAGSAFVAESRSQRFAGELKRARDRWQSKPSLGECSPTLREKADVELCQAAGRALLALQARPNDTPESALPVLAEGALALTRFSERVRYLSLAEISEKQLAGDAGPAPSASAAPRKFSTPRSLRSLGAETPRAVQRSDGPISQLMRTTVHLERDLMRNLGAYLEYAELPVRRSAFDTVKGLRTQHPQWPLLDRLVREAVVLETDPDLKRDLRELSASGLPRRSHPGQEAGSK